MLVAIFFEIQKGECIMEKEANAVLPVVGTTMPGREMRTSWIEKKIFNSPRTNKGLHMLSPAHIRAIKELPY